MTTAELPALAGTDPTVPLPVDGDRLSTPYGVTTIAPAVCEKIAARAAGEIDGVGVVRTGMSRLVPWGPGPAGATAEVDGGSATVELSLRVRYPLPVGQTVWRVREHVTRRLQELAGVSVREVTVTVADLVHDDRPARRRVE